MPKAIYWLFTLAIGLVALVPAVGAEPPQPVEFVLTGHTTGIGEMVLQTNHVNIRDLTAAGSVSGGFSGASATPRTSAPAPTSTKRSRREMWSSTRRTGTST